MRTSRRVHFPDIHTQCFELNFTVPDRAVHVFGIAVQGLDALQESGEAKALITALDASGAEQWAKIGASEV